jgi:Raf kinase inhibitor-like YbhB/YbcL family protein
MAMTFSSTVFGHGEPIPAGFTAEGLDVSPPLEWLGLPRGTKELALICDDPDAPRAEPWVHWVLYGIPAATAGLAEGVPPVETLGEPDGACQGTNDFGNIGYGGPSPPRGHGKHHYRFRLYALDTVLGLPSGLSKQELLDAMAGHILEEVELIGTYQR